MTHISFNTAFVSDFVQKLANRSESDTVENPYQRTFPRQNLEAYLRSLEQRSNRLVMIVGEAPGHRGCALTGIPFTSGALLRNPIHPLLKELKSKVQLEQLESETTARELWNSLVAHPNLVPLFCNSFPFHPHLLHEQETNRAPTSAEITEGLDYLDGLFVHFHPSAVIAVGRKAEKALKRSSLIKTFTHVRHPSFGGIPEFRARISVILEEISLEY